MSGGDDDGQKHQRRGPASPPLRQAAVHLPLCFAGLQNVCYFLSGLGLTENRGLSFRETFYCHQTLTRRGRIQEEVLVSSIFFFIFFQNQCLFGHPFLGGLWSRHHQLSKQALQRSGMCVGKGGSACRRLQTCSVYL